MDLVRGTVELEYINQKLIESGFVQTGFGSVVARQGRIVTPAIDHPSPPSVDVEQVDTLSVSDVSGVLELTVPESLDLISPDSNIPCDSPDCPIKGIQHNIGRYFHNGQRPRPPTQLAVEDIITGSIEDVNNTFNRTVPPSAIVTAYIRTCLDLHDQTDLDMVRQYKKHHMWSPIISEPVTPYPRDVFPHMHGLYGQKMLGNARGNFRESVTPPNADMEIQNIQDSATAGLFGEAFVTRPLRASDFDDSDDEDYTPDRSLESGQGRSKGYAAKIDLSPRREMPQGHELMSAKLQLQENILRKMAKHQRLQQAQSGGFCGLCDKTDKTFEPHFNDDDVALEILLGLLEALPRILQDRGLQSIFLDNRHDKRHFSESEFAILCDVQIMLKKCLADIISNATRPYQPTGIPIKAAQLHMELASVISRQQYLLAVNPGKSIADIIDEFSREGKDLLDS